MYPSVLAHIKIVIESYMCIYVMTDSEGSSTAGRWLWCTCHWCQLTGCRTQNSRARTYHTAQDTRQAVCTVQCEQFLSVQQLNYRYTEWPLLFALIA